MKRNLTLKIEDSAIERARRILGEKGLNSFVETMFQTLKGDDEEKPSRLRELGNRLPQIDLSIETDDPKLKYLQEKYLHD